MSTGQKRDAGMDRLLRAALKPAPGETAADGVETEANCPDAGILAAFIESGLTATEQSAVEMHLAGCGRCQEALSIISDHLPEELVAEVASPESTWFTWVTRPRLRWLVPVSAAATVAVVIFATRPLIAPESEEVFPADVMQMAQAPPTPPAASPAAGVEAMREKSAAVPEKSEAAARFVVMKPPNPWPGWPRRQRLPGMCAPMLAAAGMMAARVASEASARNPPPHRPRRRRGRELAGLVSVAAVTAAPDGRVQWSSGRWPDLALGRRRRVVALAAHRRVGRPVAGAAPSPATTCWIVGAEAWCC